MAGLVDFIYGDSDFAGTSISDLGNRPIEDGLTADELKARFDLLPKVVIALGKLNALIRFMQTPEFGSDTVIVDADGNPVSLNIFAENIKAVTDALSANLSNVNQTLSQSISDVNTTLGGRIDGVNSALNSKIDAVNSTLDDRIDGVDSKIDDSISGLNQSLLQVIGEVNSALNDLIASLAAESGAALVGMSPLYADDVSGATVKEKLLHLTNKILTIDVFTPRGVVDSVSDLPATGNAFGDFFYVRTSDPETYIQYVWTYNPTQWTEYGEVSLYVLENYYTKEEINQIMPAKGTALPKPSGTAEAGSSASYSSEDHVHPGAASGWYGISSTAAGTAEKAVTVQGTNAANFKKDAGTVLVVRLSASNTAAAPTINAGGSGASAIRYNGAAVAGSLLAAGDHLFQYDGTYWNWLNYPLVSNAANKLNPDFDMLLTKQGLKNAVTFGANTTVETITIGTSATQAAIRTTTFNPDGTITTKTEFKAVTFTMDGTDVTTAANTNTVTFTPSSMTTGPT